MKNIIVAMSIIAIVSAIGCGGGAQNKPVKTATSPAPPTPAPTVFTPPNGDYPGTGVVTKINNEGPGSVGMNHEEIKGTANGKEFVVMPAMPMEFNVTDKAMLNGLKIGDKIDFVLRYKDHNETIVKITKAR